MQSVSFFSPAMAPATEEPRFPIIRKRDWTIELRSDEFHLERFAGGKCVSKVKTPFCLIRTDRMSDEEVRRKFIEGNPREFGVEYDKKGQAYVYIGPPGLAGGVLRDEDSSDWTDNCARGAAYAGFAATGVYGVYKLGTGENLKEKVKGAAALGASISGIRSLHRGDSATQCVGKATLGAGLGAGSAVAAFHMPEVLGGGLKERVFSQSVVGAASGAIATVGTKIIEERALPTMREVGKGAVLGAAGGGVGTFVGGVTHGLIPDSAAEGVIPSLVRVAKEGAVGASGAGFGAFAVNAADCFVEGKKLNGENLTRGVLEASLMGGAVSASISGVSEFYRYKDYQAIQDARTKVSGIKEKLDQKKAELDKTTADCEALQEEIQVLEQELAELNTRLSPEAAKVEADLEKIDEELDRITEQKDGAYKASEEAKARQNELQAERNRLLEEQNRLQNQVNEERVCKQERVKRAKKELEVKRGGCIEAEKRYQEADAAYNKALSEWQKIEQRAQGRADRMRQAVADRDANQKKADEYKEKIMSEIEAALSKGYTAIIGLRSYADASEILKQILKGKNPIWAVSNEELGNRIGGSFSIPNYFKKYKRYMDRVKEANRNIQSLQTSEAAAKEEKRAEKEKSEALERKREERAAKNRAERGEKFAEAELRTAEEKVSQQTAAEPALQQTDENLQRAEEGLQQAQDDLDRSNKTWRQNCDNEQEVGQKREAVLNLEQKREGAVNLESSRRQTQAEHEALNTSYQGQVSGCQAREEAHTAKYPEVPDFRYLSLNSLLESNRGEEE